MDGSNGKMVELLERIANGLDATNERLDAMRGEMRAGFAAVNGRIDSTNARLDGTNARLDNALGFLGAHHADHEQRINALEARVFKKRGG